MIKKSKYSKYIDKFLDEYGPVHFESRLYKKSQEFINEYLLIDVLKLDYFVRCLKKKLLTIETRAGSKLLTNLDNPTSIELASVYLTDRTFYSHATASYMLGLIDQRPETIYLSNEIPGRGVIHSDKYDDLKIKIAFMKEERGKEPLDIIEGVSVYKISKIDLHCFDIEPTKIGLGRKKESNVTGINRTIVDCIVSPQYGGGILSIGEAIENADIDLKIMKQYYDLNQFFYPYWQRIGFLLEEFKGKDLADSWGSMFQIEKKDFYVHHQYNDSWIKNEKWKIFYPKGGVK